MGPTTVRLPQIFDEDGCGFACVGNGRGGTDSRGVGGHRAHRGHPGPGLSPARPCAPPADSGATVFAGGGRGSRSAARRAGRRHGQLGGWLCVPSVRRDAALRTAPQLRRSALRESSPSGSSKSIVVEIDIRGSLGYGFSRSRDLTEPGRHELPGSSPRMAVRWWSSEARLSYDGDGTDDRTGRPEVMRGRREQGRS